MHHCVGRSSHGLRQVTDGREFLSQVSVALRNRTAQLLHHLFIDRLAQIQYIAESSNVPPFKRIPPTMLNFYPPYRCKRLLPDHSHRQVRDAMAPVTAIQTSKPTTSVRKAAAPVAN